jgi:glycosyltransferase involved in cell wall biosynthesis
VRLICVARLSPVKRIDLLLEALALLPAAGPAWKCTIVGGGRLEAELRHQADALGLTSRVEFSGQVSDVRPFLQSADLCVLSSEKEGLPLSLIEAMAFGLPCVVTDVGGNREIVLHQKTGLLVEFGSPKALSSAIEHLLAHPEERRRMGEEARKLVHERFDASMSLQRYRELLMA